MFPEYKFTSGPVILWKDIQPSMEKINNTAKTKKKAFTLIIKYRKLLPKSRNMMKDLEGNPSLSLATLSGY